MRSEIDKFVDADPRLLNNGAQGAFGDIFAGMVGNNGASMSVGIVPNFMASFGMSIKNKTGFSEFTNDEV